jgi:nucleotide-binding universal stress UspA family protein
MDSTDASLLQYAAMVAGLGADTQVDYVHVSPAGKTMDERPGIHIVPGDRVDALLEFAVAQRTDLILLGHRRQRSGRRSLARRLAMQAPCSVWMAPENAPASIRRIVAPIDYSRRSADALSIATAIAEAAGLEECLAPHVHFNQAAISFDEYEEIIAEQEYQNFNLFIAPIDLHGIYVKPLFLEGGNVARTILRVAEQHGADLLVMGTRGRSRSAAILLGSETEHVMMETRIPILVVKHFGARLGLLKVLLDKRLRERGDERFT